DIVALPVPRGLKQVLNPSETRLAGEILGDVSNSDKHDRINFNLPIVPSVTTAHPDVTMRPDPYAAPDPAASNALSDMHAVHHQPPARSDVPALRATRPQNAFTIDTHCRQQI